MESYKINIYDSLFNGTVAPLSDELQAEYDRITKEAEAKVASMTEEEKRAKFDKMMGRS
jgi:hypothetical protein